MIQEIELGKEDGVLEPTMEEIAYIINGLKNGKSPWQNTWIYEIFRGEFSFSRQS